MDRYAELIAKLAVEIPGFRVVRKDRSRMHRVIHQVLRVVTFGQMTDYLESYQTTIGKTVYVTSDWDEWTSDRRYVTMRHEAIHLRQFRKYTLPGMAILYVFVPLPIGLAWFRAHFEREAYAESIRAAADVWGVDFPKRDDYRRHIIDQFVGASYGWMWPFRKTLERWYDGVLATL